MNLLRELCYTLLDVLATGDLRGHLAAWWDCVRHPKVADEPVYLLEVTP